jgi:hypothetical protein
MPTPKPTTLISLASVAAMVSAGASCGDSGVSPGGGGGGSAPTAGGGGSTGAIFDGGGGSVLVSGPGSGGFGGSPPAFVCDPPAEPGSLYAEDAISYDITQPDPVSMCQYRGDVLLVFNAAAI